MLTEWSRKHGTNSPQLASGQLLIQAAEGNRPGGKTNCVMIFLPHFPGTNRLHHYFICRIYLSWEWVCLNEVTATLLKRTLLLLCLCGKRSLGGLNRQEQTQMLFPSAYQVWHPVEWKAPLSSCFWSSLAVSRLHVNLWGSPTVRLQRAWSLWMLRDDRVRTTKLNLHSLSLPLEVLPINLKDLCIIRGFAFCCHNESDLLSVV